jgi:uncharacterized protein (TIGR02284 family)
MTIACSDIGFSFIVATPYPTHNLGKVETFQAAASGAGNATAQRTGREPSPRLLVRQARPNHQEQDMASDHDISVLNSLITTTIDSANGFERSAEDADAQSFSQMFREFAQERRQVVGRLQERVRQLGGTPNDDGSLKADLHRRFVDLRNAISSGDKAVIEEVERGEDYIKGKYDAALQDNELSSETLSVIREAYQSVRAGHDRASALKHGMQDA